MTKITIPNSVAYTGENTFYGCTRLISIIFKGTKAEWQNTKIDDHWYFVMGSYTMICIEGTIKK